MALPDRCRRWLSHVFYEVCDAILWVAGNQSYVVFPNLSFKEKQILYLAGVISSGFYLHLHMNGERRGECETKSI